MEMVSQPTEHHDVNTSEMKREHSVVDTIKGAILDHGNPFAIEWVRLHNMIGGLTLVYVTDEFVEQIINAYDTDWNMSEDYVTAHINGNLVFGPK